MKLFSSIIVNASLLLIFCSPTLAASKAELQKELKELSNMLGYSLGCTTERMGKDFADPEQKKFIQRVFPKYKVLSPSAETTFNYAIREGLLAVGASGGKQCDQAISMLISKYEAAGLTGNAYRPALRQSVPVQEKKRLPPPKTNLQTPCARIRFWTSTPSRVNISAGLKRKKEPILSGLPCRPGKISILPLRRKMPPNSLARGQGNKSQLLTGLNNSGLMKPKNVSGWKFYPVGRFFPHQLHKAQKSLLDILTSIMKQAWLFGGWLTIKNGKLSILVPRLSLMNP